METTKIAKLKQFFHHFAGTNQGLQIVGMNQGHKVPCYIVDVTDAGILTLGINGKEQNFDLNHIHYWSEQDKHLVNASIGDLIGRYPKHVTVDLYI